MKDRIKRCAARAGALAVLLMLGACGNLSQVSSQGTTEQAVWPDADKAYSSGIYPSKEHLAMIRPGMTKDQIYDLLGLPHFSEGFGVREWDYVFRFAAPGGEAVCQYKILFDTDKLARSFLWKPESCVDFVK